jgi:putative transposase
VSRFELIAAECAHHEVSKLAELLDVSRSGYYAWAARHCRVELSPRQQWRRDLEVKILAHWTASTRTYGSPRITADLHAEGVTVSENTVAKIMAEMGISPRTFKVKTTASTRRHHSRRTGSGASSIRAAWMRCGPPTSLT